MWKCSPWVAVIACLGCDPGDSSPSSSNAAPEVVVSTQPVWAEATLGARPILQIGATGGGGPQMFAEVATVRFSESGKIIVTDSGAERVVIFDHDGSHVVTHGRVGQGPGEFRDLARALPYPGDSLAAFDFGNNRTLVFPVGPGESRAISANFRAIRAPIFGVLTSGSMLAYQQAGRPPNRSPGQWDTTIVARFPAAGEEVQEVGRHPSSQFLATDAQQPRVLAPRSVLAGGRLGYYWARTDRYAIHQFDSLGVLRRILERPVDPPPITRSDASDYRTATIESARELAGQSAEMWEQRYRDVEFAPTRPLFGSAFVDHADRLWISELPWPSRFAAPKRWSVFSPDGLWLADVEAPDGVTLHDAWENQVVGTWRGELGISFVRVYELDAG